MSLNNYLSVMNSLLHKLRYVFFFLIAFGFQFSCVDHDFPTYTCPEEEVSYLQDVQPIVQSKCAISGCHNGSLGQDRDWTSFPVLQENAQNGKVKNYVINHIMPPSNSPAGSLNQDQVNIIACWVDSGAPNN